jgi:hypothetical protein
MARKKLSLNALSRASEFRVLTVRQQLWLQTYIQSEIDLGVADRILATRCAFDSQDEETVRTLSYETLRNKKVQVALRVWQNFGISQREIMLEDVKADIKASKPGSAARAKLRAIELKLLGSNPKKRKS